MHKINIDWIKIFNFFFFFWNSKNNPNNKHSFGGVFKHLLIGIYCDNNKSEFLSRQQIYDDK